MADAAETAHRHAKDVVAGNLAGIMADFTPEGMAKAMAMGGGPPAGLTGYELVDSGFDGEAHHFEITYKTADGGNTVVSHWKEVDGVWKIFDLAPKQ